MQYRHSAIILDFLIKALFTSYGVNLLTSNTVWHITDFQDSQSARSRVSCILILESMQQLQLLPV